MMRSQGYEVSRDLGKYGSNNGFDLVCYKGSLDDPQAIIIIEAKQFKQVKLEEFDGLVGTNYDNASGLTLNLGNTTTELPTQMSDKWVFDHVRNKLLELDDQKVMLAQKLLTHKSKVSKYLFAVDKSIGDSYFMKLSSF